MRTRLLAAVIAWLPLVAAVAETNGVAATAGAVAAADTASLRVLIQRPRVFEYLFAAVNVGTDRVPRLSLRHLSGASLLVRPGQQVGPYTVASYEPHKEKGFNPSVNATLEQDTGRVTLLASNGTRRVLVLGKPLEEPGQQMVCLVSLASGNWAYARAGDRATLDGLAFTVTYLTTNGDAVLETAAGASLVAGATDAERQAVLGIWQVRREQAEKQAAALAQAAQDARDRQTAAIEAAEAHRAALKPPPVKLSPAPAFAFGDEFRYPTAYEAVPIPMRLSNGTIIMRAVVVPTRFETRINGVIGSGPGASMDFGP